jgi:hypothetical protein
MAASQLSTRAFLVGRHLPSPKESRRRLSEVAGQNIQGRCLPGVVPVGVLDEIRPFLLLQADPRRF